METLPKIFGENPDEVLSEAVTDRLPDLAKLAGMVMTTATPHESTTVRSPFTGEILGTAPICTAEDVAIAIGRARAAQHAWAARPLAERTAIFTRYHDLVLARQDELLDLIQLESGKARLSALDEAFDVAINCRHYAVHAASYLLPRRRKGAIPFLTHTQELRHPVGVVGIVAPWNYPLSLAISDAVPALIAGNCVVLKPAEETPFIALYALQLLRESGLPADVFQIVTGKGRVIAPAFIREVDFMCFTGGTSTGRLLAGQIGERLIKYSMELGGKNPAIVLDDADVAKTATGMIRASFSNAGQLCIHTERLYVQDGIYDRFVSELVRQVALLKLSSALDFSGDIGSLLSRDQLDKVTHHVEDAVEKGATVLTGGNARPDLGPYFYEPTLLTNVTPEMELYVEETFGPVVAIYRFDKVEEAIRAANASSYGLNASIWTRDVRLGREIARQLQTGTVNVNDGFAAAWGSVDSPMGGWKTSGVGRRHGRDGILKYTESQTVAVQFLIPIGPFGILTPVRYTRLMTWLLRMLRHIPGLR
ncbi:MAG: succinic semialdehyde dehydrogenase [Chloroflexota bacterium]